ncbi:BTAD domain-containing putative transcriptional regulator [Lentzea tibetensis]|uniref:BTAD domain-containing putative transcriptional regulator n=1 Tax=Lentzea tibetensis TaxID=2591470 RepID=UPI0016475213|nr:BTAD domain-containing putative transcriptional regulator [Lentzea tibetensis]
MDQELAVFSAALRAYRKRTGLTQRQLAAEAGVSVRTVRGIECGEVCRPHPASLRVLAAATGLDEPCGVAVSVLGPLVVRRGSVEVAVEGTKQRSLLALLALRADEVVPQHEIIDVLWGDDPPRTCRDLIYVHASRLRKVLGSGAVDAASSAGYRLNGDRVGLDTARFTSLVEVGEHARALDCWRGAVLADLPDRVRQHPAALALARQRVAVTIDHADTGGRLEEARHRLEAVVPDEPLHEELHARLMLALAGCGEQGVALELYERLRDRLDRELGVHPGPVLRDAHLRVLRQEVRTRPPYRPMWTRSRHATNSAPRMSIFDG